MLKQLAPAFAVSASACAYLPGAGHAGATFGPAGAAVAMVETMAASIATAVRGAETGNRQNYFPIWRRRCLPR